MSVMRKSFFPLAVGAILVLLSGYGSAAPATTAPVGTASKAASFPPPIPANTPVSIVFENYNLATVGLGKEATEQLIGEFMQKFPNIKVEGRATGSDQIIAKVQAEVVAGNPPDIVQGVFSDLDFIVNDLKAKAIEDLVPPDEFAQYTGGQYPISPNGLKLTALNGKTFGVPYTFSTPTLFYNADLFKAAGLDPAKPPMTWAEAKQAGLQIKERTGKGGLVIDCLGQYDWCYQSLVLSNGGRVLSEDRRTVQFAQPEGVGAVQMWQDLVQSGAHPPLSSADGATAFQGGNLGMIVTTSARQASFLTSASGKYELRDAKMPAFAGKAVHPTNSGSGLFVLANDPLKQRAAWELMKFITSERGYTIITSKIGYLPLRPGIVNDPQYLKPWTDEHPLVQPNLEQLAALEPWVAFPGANYRQMVDIMMKSVEQVVYSSANAETTLKAAQDRATQLLPKR